MKYLLFALLAFGLMFQSCEPSPKDKLKAAKEKIEGAAEDVMDAAEEVAEDIEVDTTASKKEGKKINKLLKKLKNKK